MLYNSLAVTTTSSSSTSAATTTGTNQSIGSSSGMFIGMSMAPPKWAVMHHRPPTGLNLAHMITTPPTVVADDHFDRHLDTLTTTDTFRPDEGPDELNAGHVSKLMELTKNRRRVEGADQVVVIRPLNGTTTMPTPLACSRSSSLTSLSSFDAKSVHSSVASEYSAVVAAPRKKSSSTSSSSNRNGTDDEETAGEEDDDGDKTDNIPKNNVKSTQVNVDVNGCDENNEADESWDDDLLCASPTASVETSFIKRNRPKHLQQQQIYRVTAAIQQQQLSMNEATATTAPKPAPALPWQQAVYQKPIDHQLPTMMSRLGISQPAPKTVLDMDDSPTPKFIQSTTVSKPMIPASNPAPIVPPPAPTMSVAYAFMKNSHQQFNTNINPPRFLMSAAMGPSNPPPYMPFIPAAAPPPPPPQPALPHHHHHHHHHLLPTSPSTPIIPDSIQRMYAASTIIDTAQHLKSVNTSPQESVCSHRSTTSTLSIVKNENLQYMQPSQRTADKFTALLNKANMIRKNRSDIEADDYNRGAAVVSSSSSSSSSSGKSQILSQPPIIPPVALQQPPAWLQPFPKAEIIPPPIVNPIPPVTESIPDSSSTQPTNEAFYDDDLEEFINENFKQSSTVTTKLGPNTSLDENDFKPAKTNSFKRASLQSLDSAAAIKPARKPIQVAKPPARPAPKPVESAKPPTKSTAPVVNMTRTAQLRASKQQQLRNSANLAASSDNKLGKKPHRQPLNQTHLDSSSTSTRRVSIGSSTRKEQVGKAVHQSAQKPASKLPMATARTKPTATTPKPFNLKTTKTN